MPQTVDIKGFGKVHFPDGMTPEQITEAIERDILPQRRPGDTPYMSAEARERSRVNAMEPVKQPDLGVMARIGRGMLDVGQGLNQKWLQLHEAVGTPTGSSLIDPQTGAPRRPLTEQEQRIAAGMKAPETSEQLTQRVNAELEEYNKGRAAQGGGLDLARIAGNVVATAPLAAVGPAAATIPARAAAGAIQGAIAGGAQFTPSGEARDALANAAVGAGVGAVAAPAVGYASDKIGQGIRKLVGAWRGANAQAGIDDILNAIPELQELPETARRDLILEAQKMIRTTGALDADQLARKANLIAQGVKPTKSMVTRNPGDWTMERNLSKLAGSPDEQLSTTGQELTKLYEANDKALTASLRKLSEKLPKGTQEAQGMKVMQSLDDLAKASQEDVSKLYGAVRDAKGDQLASDARQLFSTLDDLRDSAYADKLISSVERKLQKFGMMAPEGHMGPLKPTNNTLTVTQAEELRKFVNKLPNDFGRQDIVRAIDSDVLSGLGEDAFGGARAAAASRFAMLENPATQRALNALGELQQGKTAQSFIKSQIINGADQDVATLVETLGKLPKDKADEAMNALRAGVLKHLEDAAGNPNSGKFSGAAFNKAIDEIGAGKLVRILGAEQFKKLQNLARAALDATYEPPYSAVNQSNSGTTLLSFMRGARTVPGVPLIITDQAEQMAAQAAARKQLADIIAARANRPLPALPASAETISRVLRTPAATAPAAIRASGASRERR